jgi:hypothetical protein
MTRHDDHPIYQIRLEGQLGPEWSEWFDGLDITLQENGEMVLSGPLPDQAALHGVLARICDLGMVLISVNRVKQGPGIPSQT